MASLFPPTSSLLLISCLLVLLIRPVSAFGAGNVPSIAKIEGLNWRHGDIEDMLKTIAFIKGHKWTSMMVKRVYFGNWLRDYSQAVDVGSLKGVNAATIRILVWVLSFLSFGYATAEFEVTEERLGVYRPEEHIDNPKDYADNKDARQYDARLRGPIQPAELEVDPNTGMKNYIANERGGWATSTGYIKHSFSRSIHFGRVYTHGAHGTSGKEADLCEALRCLGQGLHCMEDFGAHTNYCELALRELNYRDVFPHCGNATEVNVHNHKVFPLVTGTFGGVDFLHSVLGEATDHFTQTEVEEMDIALKSAEQSQSGGASGQRGLFNSGGTQDFAGLLSQVPGMGGSLASTARDLQASSAAQESENRTMRASNTDFIPPPSSIAIPGMSANFDPIKTAAQIYPILEFRDRVVKAINATIAKIPGLEALVERISETLTVFILSLLAPFVRPIIDAVSASLKKGSSTVVEASANQQFEPWNDSRCTNPTHSMLSKDHFTNILNGCAGRVAATILTYVTPRILYAWENPGVPVDEVMNDIVRVFHHPALRDGNLEIHRNMFNTVRKWVDENPDRHNLNNLLSSASVKAGNNHTSSTYKDIHSHGALGGHGKTSGSIWSEIQSRDLGAMEGRDGNPYTSYLSSSPQPPGSPSRPQQSPNFGYQNLSQNSGSGYQDRPYSSGSSHLTPNYQQESYQSGPPPMNYHQGYPQPNYGGGYQGVAYQQPPYGPLQPPAGQWPQGPPQAPPYSQGPPYTSGPGGPPPSQYPGGYYPQQPPYPNQNPPGAHTITMPQFHTTLPPKIAQHADTCLQIYEQICKNHRMARDQEDASQLSLRAMEFETLSLAERELKLQEHRVIDQQVRNFRFQQDVDEGKKLFRAAINCMEYMMATMPLKAPAASRVQDMQGAKGGQVEAPKQWKRIIDMANVPEEDTIVRYQNEWYIMRCVLCGHQHGSAASLYSHINQGDAQHISLLGGVKKHCQAVEASGTMVTGVTLDAMVAHNKRALEIQQQARDDMFHVTVAEAYRQG